ncbi:hypothetical protein NA78x_005211 [Anatilimnocola sp. NA78]|uniref:hypothetical protein n=1 Tax=Anatilimnocola sp. NA78 TaxID=3415683 RepID=UPI003CE50018
MSRIGVVNRSLLVLVAVLLGTIAGCGGGAGGLTTVSGTVKVDGEPLKKGAISFLPVDGQSTTAGGAITDGTFTVQVPKGMQKVVINAPKVTGMRKLYDTPDSPTMETTAESLPAKYHSATELTLDVKGGSVKQDWDLSTK